MDETVIDQIIQATGLPQEQVKEQLHKWVLATGKSPQSLSLEDLREVLIYFLQDLFCEVKSGQNDFIKLSG